MEICTGYGLNRSNTGGDMAPPLQIVTKNDFTLL